MLMSHRAWSRTSKGSRESDAQQRLPKKTSIEVSAKVKDGNASPRARKNTRHLFLGESLTRKRDAG